MNAASGDKAAFSAAVCTRITDVETELNGLLTYDREVMKLTGDRVREVNLKLTNIYGEEPKEDLNAGINNQSSTSKPLPSAIYSLSGMQQDGLTHGLNIVRSSDGSVSKVLVRR